MPITVVSTTDPQPQDDAAAENTDGLSNEATESVEDETQSASTKAKETESKEDETIEASDTSEDEPNEDDQGQDENDEDEKGDKPRKSKKGGYQRRIDKLTKRLADKDRELEYLREMALRGSSKGAGSKTQDQVADTTETKVSDKPRADDFDTHEDFVEALTDWKLEKKLAAEKKAAEDVRLKAQFQDRVTKHQERVQAFADEVEDFHDVIEDVDDIPMSLTVQEIILDSDNGPELMYELAKDPEEYKRICALSPAAAARAIGRFEAKINSKGKEERKEIKTTKAPRPIETIKGKGTAVKKDIYDPNISFKEFERLERERLSRKEASY